MRLQVRHVTRAQFADPVPSLVQSQRLYPSEFAGQTVVDWKIETTGGVSDGISGGTFRDGAGDLVETVTLRGPVTEVAVTVTGTVETADLFGVLRGFRERIRPSAYLRATRQTKADDALVALGAETVSGMMGRSDLDRAHALSQAVSEAIAYTPGATESSATAAEALEQGQGVCQDQAHALIALAHETGLPARYVTGYLLADDQGLAHEASHAWAELYISDLGWVGFDPANRCCANDQYIRLGSGFDATDAAPIRGLVQGAVSEESLNVEVVVTLQQQQ